MTKYRKIILKIFLLVILVFSGLKIYVFYFETNFHDLNILGIKEIKSSLDNKEKFSFAVVGNVENSLDIFDKKIIPQINKSNIDFVIFSGDFLMDGGADKYGAFYKTLKKINVPVITAVGDNEISDYGTKKYSKYFGPFYYSFSLADSYFIFIDTTGETSEEWQKEWIINELKSAEKYNYRFVISNRVIVKAEESAFNLIDNGYVISSEYRKFLINSFSKYGVTAVLSSSNIATKFTEKNGVKYFADGGGGGLMLNINQGSYGFIKFDVDGGMTNSSFIKIEDAKTSLYTKIWDSLWFRLHSWFYIAYINFILSSSIIFFIIYFVYSKLIETPNYYSDFKTKKKEKKFLTIAMFTNNYLPFIGGVPISIYRLKKGLEKMGHTVYVFAPKYSKEEEEKNVIRCKPLFYYSKKGMIVPVTNIFSTKIKKRFLEIKPDIVHIHHPYWLGAIGLYLAKKYNIPTVYTYHTRLEQYNHYIPFLKKLAGGRLPHMLIKQFANSCQAIIAPTKLTKKYLRNLGVGKIVKVLPTGVDFDTFRNNNQNILNSLRKKFKANNELILFSVFRLSKEKNPYFLLEGIKKIKKDSAIKFKCLIAGDGPEEAEMEKFIEKNNLQDIVYLLGKISPQDIPVYYQLADIFIFSSKSETQGMVLLEAMAGLCPVVAIDSSGIDDMIIDGKNGFKTKDDLDNWCEKIMDLMNNKEFLLKLSAQANNFLKKYSLETIAGKVASLYEEIYENNQ